MRRLMKNSMGCLVWILAWTHMSSEAFGRPDAAHNQLSIHLLNNGAASEDLVAAAKEHVQRIFGKAGIQISWDEGAGLELNLILVGKHMHEFDAVSNLVTGVAVGNNGQGPRRAYVFVERVKEQAAALFTSARYYAGILDKEQIAALNSKRTEALILGHVIAHELGHLLLPHGAHSETGIMSHQIDSGKYRRAVNENLFFSPDQSMLMQSVFLRSPR